MKNWYLSYLEWKGETHHKCSCQRSKQNFFLLLHLLGITQGPKSSKNRLVYDCIFEQCQWGQILKLKCMDHQYNMLIIIFQFLKNHNFFDLLLDPTLELFLQVFIVARAVSSSLLLLLVQFLIAPPLVVESYRVERKKMEEIGWIKLLVFIIQYTCICILSFRA